MEKKGVKLTESRDSHEDEALVPRFTLEPMASFLLLPDDCLLSIMKYLGPVELHNLTKISDRLKDLVKDRKLWTSIDFRPHKLTVRKLANFVEYFSDTTKFLAIKGFANEPLGKNWKQEILMPNIFNKIISKCSTLETLILEENLAVSHEINLESFPNTLRHLSLKGCVMGDLDPQRSYFHKMHLSLPLIKVLVLSNCAWVSPHDFMAISKCHYLEELRLDGCPQLGECVAYTSLAARFGFHSLKILDLRNTRMGDSDVGCFNRSRNLTHLYLECPKSYHEDSDGLCGDRTCMELPIREDFMDLSDEEQDAGGEEEEDDEDEDDIQALLLKPINSGKQVHVASTRHLANSSYVSSKYIKSLLPVCQKEYELDESSTSKKHNEVKGNGDADLLQPSTSHGTLHVIIDAAGPGPSAGQKVGVSRKRQSCDSDSSSDGDSFVISSTNELHPSESKHQSMMSKRLHSKSGFEDDCRSRKAKRRCIAAGSSLKISKSVLKPVPADSSGDAATASSTNEQKDKLLLSQRPIPASDENEIDDSRPSDTSQETWTFKTDEHGTTYRFLRNWRQNCNGPLLFRLPHHEPSSDSTISDMCIMAFLLSDEADGVGYVRIMAPQFTSTQPKLHTLVIKNYKMITDATLLYLMKVRSLRELDVSGTSVTEGGILQFKLKRPEVNVTCDFKNLPV